MSVRGFPRWDVARSTGVCSQRRKTSAASVSRARPHLQEGLWTVPGLRIGWDKCERVTGRAEAESKDGWSKCHGHAFQGWWQKASIWSEMQPLQRHTTPDQGLPFQGSSVPCMWQNRPHCKGLPQQGQHSEQRAGRQEVLQLFCPMHASTDCWGQTGWDVICPFSRFQHPGKHLSWWQWCWIRLRLPWRLTQGHLSWSRVRVPSGRLGREAAPNYNPLMSVCRRTQESPMMSLGLVLWTWNTKVRGNLYSSISWMEPAYIVGTKLLHKLKLKWPAIWHLSSSLTLESVLDMHNAVFNEELGCVQGMSARSMWNPGQGRLLPTSANRWFVCITGQSKLFSKLDLAHTYQQIPLPEESKKFVVINTHKGLYRYNCLPFSISSASAIFQRMMEAILQGTPMSRSILNDILVPGATDRQHLQNLQEVLTRLEKAGIRLKEDKCAFMLAVMEYLGHEIKEAGLKPTPS